uniref:hypothetical protein n=1 Tax=Streptomyces clavuligerus TaxID=1901 RepID=UPI0027DE19DE
EISQIFSQGKDGLAVQEAPIYDRLVAELGDIPTEVRREAERTLRDLDRIIRPGGPQGPVVRPYTPGTLPATR